MSYRNFLRMDLQSFEELLSKVGPLIRKENTVMRRSIEPEERLALTLRWLATGRHISIPWFDNLICTKNVQDWQHNFTCQHIGLLKSTSEFIMNALYEYD